ncbi:MAG: hypothetical protein K8R40_11120 [Anaerolineaceae bacterium]|nr:hypothetical protein [Anaerolineaceae bacterium]
MKKRTLIVKLLALVSASFSFIVISKYLHNIHSEKTSDQQDDLYPDEFPKHEKILLETSSAPVNAEILVEHLEDDLKQIDGIGPKYETVLKNSGINSFHHLANFKTEELETLLRDADVRIINCATWVEQAKTLI